MADDETARFGAPVNAQAVLSSRIVRLPRAAARASHSMCIRCYCRRRMVEMLASKALLTCGGESDANFIDRVSRQIREDSLRALADLLPANTRRRRSAKASVVVPRAADAFIAVAPRQCAGHGGRTSRSASAAGIRDRVRQFAMAHAYLAATMGNLSMYEQVTPEEAWRVGSAASRRAGD